MNTLTRGRGRWPLLRHTALGAGMVVALAACDVDQIMDIDDPEFPGAGQIPIAAIAAGATGEFQRAYSGAAAWLHDEGYITVSAAMSDEFRVSDTFTTRIALDQRNPQPVAQGNISDAAFRWLQRTRRAARDAVAQVVDAGTTSGAGLARLHAIEAYTWNTLGEGYCGAVPISNLDEHGLTGGPVLSTAQLFEGAVERFDRALAAEAGNHLAAVGKGRALLNLGRFADAAAAVSGVPTSFAYFFEHSNNDGFQRNNIAALQDNGRWSIGDNHGGNGLPYLSSGDPRVPWIRLDGRAGFGFDASVPLYQSQRYRVSTSTAVNNAANVVLADGIEARLIQAEAAFHTGGDWLGMLNELRANFASLMADRYENYAENLADGVAAGRLEADLPPLTDPGNDAARIDMIFAERAYWLQLTGHRLGDLRRLARAPYNRPVNSVFPTGTHFMGPPFGDAVAFPVPQDEENNPNFNHGMCDVRQP
jgi:starch-binding outer membrane protein, SusD/RagB family